MGFGKVIAVTVAGIAAYWWFSKPPPDIDDDKDKPVFQPDQGGPPDGWQGINDYDQLVSPYVYGPCLGIKRPCLVLTKDGRKHPWTGRGSDLMDWINNLAEKKKKPPPTPPNKQPGCGWIGIYSYNDIDENKTLYSMQTPDNTCPPDMQGVKSPCIVYTTKGQSGIFPGNSTDWLGWIYWLRRDYCKP